MGKMNELDLERFSDQAVGVILRELQGAIRGLPEHSAWLGLLSSRIREVIRRDLAIGVRGSQFPSGLADELAMTAYLTVATAGPDLELTPALLPRLSRRLSGSVFDQLPPARPNQDSEEVGR